MRSKVILITIFCVHKDAGADTEEEFEIDVTYEKWVISVDIIHLAKYQDPYSRTLPLDHRNRPQNQRTF